MFKCSPHWLCTCFHQNSTVRRFLKNFFFPSWIQTLWIVFNLISKNKDDISRDWESLDASVFSVHLGICLYIYLFVHHIYHQHLIHIPGVELGPGDSNVGEKLCWSTRSTQSNGGPGTQSFWSDFFLLMYSWCMLLYKLQVYNIVACNF